MLRRLLITSILGLALIPLGAATAATEGKEYVTLEKPLAGKTGKLVKVWSYACPFCYKFGVAVDPKVLPKIEKSTGLKFEPIHLETKGDYGRVASTILAALELRDEAAHRSVEDPDSLFAKARDAWYFAYHKQGERWTEGEEAFVKTASDATGIPVSELEKMRAEPAAVALADEWKKTYDVAKIQGVPAYVVNGKYLIMTREIRNFDGFVNLVEELARKPGA